MITLSHVIIHGNKVLMLLLSTWLLVWLVVTYTFGILETSYMYIEVLKTFLYLLNNFYYL